ncbi:MAG: GNAT family N-acetyltransferase [Clostridiales bacterium]|nr:GNAT family N-acetyltransferase [Clostridiales bacterium]
MSNSTYEIIDSCEDIDFQKVSELLKYYGLSDLDGSTQRQVFLNSYVTIFIMKEDELIGVGRAISDGISQGAIYNIAVKDEYRGKGLGKRIVAEILKRLSGCNVILYTHPKHIGLYEHWGFRRMSTSYARFPEEQYYEQEGFFTD